jgi:urea transport system substrate-binding protein
MRSNHLFRLLTLLLAFTFVAAACGSDGDSDDAAEAGTDEGTTEEASGDTCVDGDTVKLGFLNSTSGVMAISEQTVRDSLTLAPRRSTPTAAFSASRSR